ncbi:TonB-dependent receptor plug domain-containing protein [Tenacibaculum agarivorans]|uniref:TonB-dependent receptor plug domain-containing protein n=1 Tax=Tenacibaculum agarivorans TaxID=1908389 RepID=UPI00094BC5A1|nr:TonB-dependent receptor [Tenacibaculum agarivorans]
MKQVLFSIICFCAIYIEVYAQKDTITNNQLNEVVVQANKRLVRNSTALKVTTINDSIIVNNLESFTSLLRYNTSLYLREHGVGGTSSARFRGTSSSNTAVLWNGININSINNGQTGFNSLTVGLYDELNVRSGGGSIEFGSGAIGGTIHLNDILKFNEEKKFKNQLVGTFGSFATINSLYKLKYQSKTYAANFGISYNGSDNDYPFLNSEFRNANGAYDNYTINFSNAYKFSDALVLEFFTTYYLGDRLLSGELPNPTAANDKYQDINQRNLLSLQFKKNNLRLTTRLAYLFQKYKYFDDKELDAFNFGSSDRIFADVTIDYTFPSLQATLSSNTRFESVYGRTDQISERNRQEFSQSLIFNHNLKRSFSYDIKVRKDYNSDFDVPLSYAFGFKLKPISHFFLRANTSRNYRVPTYNDLFWPGQGNLDLVPETSLQGEVGIGYQSKKVNLDIAYFTINTEDNIVWMPGGDPNRPGVWTPVNIEETLNQGIEASFNFSHSFLDQFATNFSMNYTYVDATNKNTEKSLPFVPKHIANTNVSVSYKRLSIFYQNLFNGKIYTTESNHEDFVVDNFNVSNIGLRYNFIKTEKQNMSIGGKVNNLFNTDYVIIQNRPMPGINYNLNINYTF